MSGRAPILAFPVWAHCGLLGAVACGLAAAASPARAQGIDLSHGGQINVTARGGFDWNQHAQSVTAFEDARAVRGNVTVTADRLVAFYRRKPGANTPAPAKASPRASNGASPVAPSAGAAGIEDTGANEIYRLEASGHVHIFTPTDQAWGDHAVYDIDQAVLVLTGHALRLTTPSDVLTARDSMVYWSKPRMSVGRGDATVTTNDGRRIRADVLVGYSAPPGQTPAGQAPAGQAPPAAAPPGGKAAAADPVNRSGKLEKVDAFGDVVVRTRTETVAGDRGVYVPSSGIARIVGNVHITRGQNQLNGAAAIVDMHTGIATMTEAPGARVRGLIVPNSGAPAPDRRSSR